MKIAFKGIIRSRKVLKYKGRECYGLTRADKDQFWIDISERTFTDQCFAETTLHELLHLWFFIIHALGSGVPSEDEQHEILETAIPTILSRAGLILQRRRNSEKIKKCKKK